MNYGTPAFPSASVLFGMTTPTDYGEELTPDITAGTTYVSTENKETYGWSGSFNTGQIYHGALVGTVRAKFMIVSKVRTGRYPKYVTWHYVHASDFVTLSNTAGLETLTFSPVVVPTYVGTAQGVFAGIYIEGGGKVDYNSAGLSNYGTFYGEMYSTSLTFTMANVGDISFNCQLLQPTYGTPEYFGDLDLDIAIDDVDNLVYTYSTSAVGRGAPIATPVPTSIVWVLQAGQTALASEDAIYLLSQNSASIMGRRHAAFMLFKFNASTFATTQGIKFKGYYWSDAKNFGRMFIWNETNSNYEPIGSIASSNTEVVAHISERQISEGKIGDYIYIVAEVNSIETGGGQTLRADYIRVNGMGYEV